MKADALRAILKKVRHPYMFRQAGKDLIMSFMGNRLTWSAILICLFFFACQRRKQHVSVFDFKPPKIEVAKEHKLSFDKMPLPNVVPVNGIKKITAALGWLLNVPVGGCGWEGAVCLR